MATRRKFLGAAAVVVASGSTALAAPAAHPEAGLIVMCAEALWIDAENYALYQAGDLAGHDTPEWAAYNRHDKEQMPRWRELLDRIAGHRARTPEGIRAKAEVALSMILLGADGQPDKEDLLVWSTLNEVLGRA